MSEYAMVSIERVISGVYRDLRPKTQLEENDLIEWAAEALEQIGAYTQYTEAVEYVPVKISSYVEDVLYVCPVTPVYWPLRHGWPWL